LSAKRGQGRVYRPKYKDRHDVIRESSIWWIQYSIRGKRIRESAKTERLDEATALLAKRLGSRGRAIPQHKLDRVEYRELEKLIQTHYRIKGRRSTKRLKISLRHLRAYFDGWRVVDISTGAIDAYIVHRLGEGAANGSINRECAALRKALNLAARAGMARDLPVFEMLPEAAPRKGFWTDAELEAVLEHSPDYLKPVIEAAHVTGWRRGDLLSRRWRHVDLGAGWLRIDPGETKDGAGRNFPLIPQLREVLERQMERRKAIERETGRLVAAVFFRDDGKPIVDYKKEWTQARIDAGLWMWAEDENGDPVYLKSGERKRWYTRSMHDFRRTAARNLTRAGIPENQAMKFTGHATNSVFRRYAIADSVSMIEAGEKYAAQLAGAKTRAKSEGAKAVSL
jgi:integrase